MGVIRSRGSAPSTEAGRLVFEANFNKFLVAQKPFFPEWPVTVAELTEEQANDKTVFERYAFYLVYECKTPSGRELAWATCKGYLRGVIVQVLKPIHGKSGNNLDKSESPKSWLSIVTDNMERLRIQAAYEEGAGLDSESTALHRKHMIDIMTALTNANTRDAAFKKHVLLQSYLAVGRGGESVANSWRITNFRYDLEIVVLAWRDIKSSKEKPVPLLPDIESSFMDIYHATADSGAWGIFNIGGPPEAGEQKFVFHQLAKVQQVATKLSNMLQALVPGTPGPYSAFTVESLSPENYRGVPTSKDMRCGPIQEMDGFGVDPDHRRALSGHAPGGGGAGGAMETHYDKVTAAKACIGK